MKKYKITFGTGTAWTETRIIEVENFECEQDAIDKLIDELENEGSEGYFIPNYELSENGGEYFEDEYITGGNQGRNLYHGGNLIIEEITE